MSEDVVVCAVITLFASSWMDEFGSAAVQPNFEYVVDLYRPEAIVQALLATSAAKKQSPQLDAVRHFMERLAVAYYAELQEYLLTLAVERIHLEHAEAIAS